MKKNIKILGVVLTALVFTIGTVKADDPKKIDPKTGLPVKGNTSNQQGGKQKGNKDRVSLVEKLELTKEEGTRPTPAAQQSTTTIAILAGRAASKDATS